MIRFFALLLLLTFGNSARTVFHAPAPESQCRLLSFTGVISGDRIQLQWIVAENRLATRFEVERSSDGRNFSTTALVFSSEKTDEDHYRYAEKHEKKKIFYRIRIIRGDGSVQLSPMLEIDPSAKPQPTEQTKLDSYADYC